MGVSYSPLVVKDYGAKRIINTNDYIVVLTAAVWKWSLNHLLGNFCFSVAKHKLKEVFQ